MKKAYSVIMRIIPVVVMAFSITYVVFEYGVRSGNPFIWSEELKNPFFATKDSSGLFYVIENSKTRIIVFSREGVIQGVLKGGERSDSNFFYASSVIKGSDGYIYLINIVNSLNMYAVEKEEILRFHPDGKFDRIVYQKIYDADDTPVRWGRLTNLHEKNGELIAYYIYPDGIDRIKVQLKNLILHKEEVLKGKLTGMPVKGIDSDGNGVVYLTKKGEVIRRTAEGKTTLIYDGKWDPAPGGEKSVPGHISVMEDGTVAMSDLEKRSVIKIDGNGGVNDWVSPSDLAKLNLKPFEDRIKNMNAFDDGTMVEIFGDAVVYHEAGVNSSFSGLFKYRTEDIVLRFIWWGAAAAALVSLIIIILQIYWYNLNRRIPLIIKQICVYIPLVITVMIFTSWYIQNDYTIRIKRHMENRLTSLLNLIPGKIDGDVVESIKDPHEYMSEKYMTLRNTLHEVLNYNRDDWSSPFYVLIHRRIGSWQYLMIDYDDSTPIYWPYEYNPEESYVDKVMAGGIVTDFSEDQEGIWIFGNAPLRNSRGEIVAIVEIGADLYNYKNYENILFYRIMKVMIVSIVFIALAIIIVSYFMISAIRRLRKGVQDIANGSWDTQVNIRTKDEVQDLGEGFNRMAESIKNYVSEISEINKVYFKFMPYQFMEYLKINNITGLKLGDHAQGFMSVMFSDIRSFTSHSESITPKENFEFVNRFLSLTGPEIRIHGGFIDKYIGDAIMALFPSANDAVDAAISMYRKTCINPDTRINVGREPIAIGIGIFTGPVMLGIVGEEERMSSTVISDTVNIASRIESLTKIYSTGILISKSTLNSMTETEKYNYRFLGNVQVKGKNEPVGIFEILDCLDEQIKQNRIRTKEAFESAIKAYHKGNYDHAVTWFEEVLQSDGSDGAARMYLDMCHYAIRDNVTTGRMFVFDRKE